MAALVSSLVQLSHWHWLSTAVVLLASYWLVCFYRHVSLYPKGPLPLPLMGNLFTLGFAKDLSKKAERWSKVYGDPFTLWMGHRPVVVLNSYAVIKEAFVDKRQQFAGRLERKLGIIQLEGNHDVFFEDYTPTWKALRTVLLGSVRKYAVSEPLETLCTKVVDAYVDSLQGDGPRTVDIRQTLSSIVYNLVGTSVFSAKFEGGNADLEKLRSLNHAFSELGPNGLPSDIAPWLGILHRSREKRLKALMRSIVEILRRLYTRAEKSYVPGTTSNLTHSILAAREEAITQQKGHSVYLTEGNLAQVTLDTFLGAADSTTGELRGLFSAITRDTTIQDRIQKEIDDTIGNAAPTYNDKDRLPYTFACILETLRCYPVSPIGVQHKISCNTTLGGVAIPEGTGLLYNVQSVNHDPTLWKDPDVFNPGRFLHEETGMLVTDTLAPILTFGLGPRRCPGEKLAHTNMFYIVVRLLQRLRCTSPGGNKMVLTKRI